MKGSKD